MLVKATKKFSLLLHCFMATTNHLYMFHTYMWLGETFLASSEDKMYEQVYGNSSFHIL
jgi:hypothetical protein